MTYEFTTDKVRKVTLNNFRGTYGNENIIVGKRDLSDFRKIKRAVKLDKVTIYLDLG